MHHPSCITVPDWSSGSNLATWQAQQSQHHAPPAPLTSIFIVPLGPRFVFITSYNPFAAFIFINRAAWLPITSAFAFSVFTDDIFYFFSSTLIVYSLFFLQTAYHIDNNYITLRHACASKPEFRCWWCSWSSQQQDPNQLASRYHEPNKQIIMYSDIYILCSTTIPSHMHSKACTLTFGSSLATHLGYSLTHSFIHSFIQYRCDPTQSLLHIPTLCHNPLSEWLSVYVSQSWSLCCSNTVTPVKHTPISRSVVQVRVDYQEV